MQAIDTNILVYTEIRSSTHQQVARKVLICFPRMLISDDTFEFCEKMIRDTGIMLVPSRMFQYGNQHVRFGYGRKNLSETIERFADYLDPLLREKR